MKHPLHAVVRPITFKNKYGIIGASADLSDADVRRIIKGPIAAAEPAYQAELKKPAIITAEDWPNAPHERPATQKL